MGRIRRPVGVSRVLAKRQLVELLSRVGLLMGVQ